jgi:hypothetical protein
MAEQVRLPQGSIEIITELIGAFMLVLIRYWKSCVTTPWYNDLCFPQALLPHMIVVCTYVSLLLSFLFHWIGHRIVVFVSLIDWIGHRIGDYVSAFQPLLRTKFTVRARWCCLAWNRQLMMTKFYVVECMQLLLTAAENWEQSVDTIYFSSFADMNELDDSVVATNSFVDVFLICHTWLMYKITY